MSRHEAVLRKSYESNDPLVRELEAALESETAALERMRLERNKQTTRATALHGTVRGLEAKVQRLEEELTSLRQKTSATQQYLDGYAEGQGAVADAIREVLSTMTGGDS